MQQKEKLNFCSYPRQDLLSLNVITNFPFDQTHVFFQIISLTFLLV